MGEGVLLVHGFSRDGIVANLEAILGRRAGSIVHCRAPNGIVALASRLGCDDPETAFDTPEAVTALALDHAEVLAGLAALSDVVPLRLGTIVSGAEALAALCDDQAAAMSFVLDTIRGRVELGVRLRLRADEAEPPVRTASSGRSYLRARAVERCARQQTSERQQAFCQALTEHLQTLAEVRTLAFDPSRAAAGRVLDLACLVLRAGADGIVDDLAGRIQAAQSVGLDIEVTGPWPAYSFVAPYSASDPH